MLAKRIIPCLDVRDGKVVKGVNFEGIKEVGDPVACAYEYNLQGADQIVFYDITASHEGRGVMLDVVRETAKKVFVPLTVGGGIKTVDDIRDTLRAGADKVSVNSQAVQNPQLIKDGADIFGSQCICVGIDAKKVADNKWTVYINGGRIDMQLDLIDWVKRIEQLGAGEICLNSIDTDGVRGGFELPMLKAVCSAVKIPVIASGGAGKLGDFAEAFLETDCSAALAASLFHFKELTVSQVKADCRSKGDNREVKNEHSLYGADIFCARGHNHLRVYHEKLPFRRTESHRRLPHSSLYEQPRIMGFRERALRRLVDKNRLDCGGGISAFLRGVLLYQHILRRGADVRAHAFADCRNAPADTPRGERAERKIRR